MSTRSAPTTPADDEPTRPNQKHDHFTAALPYKKPINFMTWLTSISAAVISGIAGLFLAGFIANACVSWYHVSSREGASGYYVIFMAIGGGIAGLIIGLIAARIAVTQLGSGFGKELSCALGVVLAIAGISALLCRVFADVSPLIDGRPLNLEVEFRFPNTAHGKQPPTAEGDDWEFTLAALSAGQNRRTYRSGEIQTQAARFENGQWIVPTQVELFTERGKRNVMLARRSAKEVVSFLLPLPARPDATFEAWSAWTPRQQANGQPWPADKMSCRFRVQKIPLPPPPQSEAEWRAEQDAEKEKVFAAIPNDAPVQAWFTYLDYQQPQTERAVKLIASRLNLAAELGQLALGEDAELAGKALRCIEKLPAPTKEFIAPVEAAGRNLIERIRLVNATTAEADPSYEGAANASIRFTGWMCAVRALREKCGGDFTPELKTILELSRVREDSRCMRQDICRVASYYMREWTCLAPLPTDPKPK